MPPQRLALFLDGTWNTEDDSTNVLHAYNLAKEGLSDDGYMQKRYYDRGVGTGVFEKVIGGGLGVGLEINVREAYNWLVDNYNENDEIYVFGFSRGAYTARSLVSFIASCGLVERGAPLTITQLWKGYTFISQNRSIKNKEWWKKALEDPKNQHCFRRITDLKRGKWVNSKTLNRSEELVQQWSRRVEITFLGIFDTVGALGIEALGIPGVSGKLSKSHNQHPSSIIKNCRHALAIDEYRGSFRLTPFLNYVHNKTSLEKKDGYDGIIQQKWFIGAHSNIGGGYPDNTLSSIPMDWVMEGAKAAGLEKEKLVHERRSSIKDTDREDIQDSYADFTGIVWPHLLREKRNYRPIGRPELVRTNYTLETIDEKIDDSVLEYAEKDPEYAPPHLLAYANRSSEAKVKESFAGRLAKHQWPDHRSWQALPILMIWSLLAVSGLEVMSKLFWIEGLSFGVYGRALVAALFVLIDWGESRTNLEMTLHPKAVILRTIWNLMFWGRLLGVLAFIAGTIALIIDLYTLIKSWNLELLQGNVDLLAAGWSTAFIAVIAVVLFLNKFGNGNAIKIRDEKPLGKVKDFAIQKSTGDNRILLYLALVLFAAGFMASVLKFKNYAVGSMITGQSEQFSGYLLLILILLFVFIKSLDWVGTPMSASRANLGSIFRLQCKFTKSQVNELFNEWIDGLRRNWVKPEDKNQLAFSRLREILREALWRDLLWFIPIYSLVFAGILYIGAEKIDFCYLAGMDCDVTVFAGLDFWLIVVLVTALADVIENIVHLRHIRNYPRGGSSPFLVATGAFFTVIKFIGFFSTALMSLIIFGVLFWELLPFSGGWRWLLGISISFLFIMSLLGAGFKAIKNAIGGREIGKEDE